ncbi:hypothetical protein [Streptomyces sp. NBC_00280]|uniref:hypothetical protein n=1 Tax=Streptomyces sp. NBC_00280 TaxID=2975699 RepID=UPI003254F296
MAARPEGLCYYSRTDDEMWTCSHALLDASQHLPGEVIGLLRRSAKECWRRECMEPVLGRLRGPVLSPGDFWADHVLTELPLLGGPWHALVEHAVHAPVGRPTRIWDRRALALADPLDLEQVRHTVAPWLFFLLRPHPASIRTLGALVERRP